MADAGDIWFRALSGVGNNIADSMQQYHKEHQVYDQQSGIADVLSRMGVNQQGQLTPIDPNNPDKTIQPVVDKKALELYQSNNHAQQQKNLGAIEALNRIGMNLAGQTLGPLRQAQLKQAQLATQRYSVPTQYGDVQATGGQALQSDLENQRINLAKQPKGPTTHQQFLENQKVRDAMTKQIQSSPEFKFQQKYGVFPKQVITPDVIDPGKQAYRLFKADGGTELTPEYDDYGVARRPSYLKPDQKSYWTPTTDIYRFNEIQRDENGVKTTQHAPDPTGKFVSIGGQHIPFSDIQGIANRHDAVLKDAIKAITPISQGGGGRNPAGVADMYAGLGYDPAELGVQK